MTPNRPWLNLNGIIYNSDQLISGIFKSDLNLFEQHTLHFIHHWLTGEKTFQLHTSGSTGSPKSITITRDQMEASALRTIKALRLKHDYTSLVCLDTQYIAGQMMLVRSLMLGMNIVAVDPESNPFVRIPVNQSLDFAAMVPYQLQTILNSASRSRLNNVKTVIVGGAPLDPVTIQNLQALNCECYATYGMTETISHIALQRLNGEQHQDLFEVMEGIDLSQDDRGCLVIQADYLGKEKIVTNDLVEVISKNRFRWLGRWDNIINSGGVKVMPEKVEQAVQQIFDFLKLPNRFFVAGMPDEKLNSKVALIIEGNTFPDDVMISLERAFENLDRYERPRIITFLINFKVTETGKIQRTETLDLIPASSH